MGRALGASMVATALAAVLAYVNVRFGFLPQFDLIAEIAEFNGRIGLPVGANALWTTHAVIGIVVWGIAYAVLLPVLPGSGAGQGMTFGVLAWLVMMASFMPLAGNAPFGTDLGPVFIAGALGFHLVYGAILGATHAALTDSGG